MTTKHPHGGATDELVHQAEAELGIELPEELKSIWRTHNCNELSGSWRFYPIFDPSNPRKTAGSITYENLRGVWGKHIRSLGFNSSTERQRYLAMCKADVSTFETRLLRPASPGKDGSWAFLVLPKAESDKLPRRGRTPVEGTINGCPFQATLDPDGQLSHWLKVSKELRDAAHANIGDMVAVRISPANPEPEPQLPDDLQEALAASPAAKATWEDTTTIARVDWIHWIESAKQAKTRKRRVDNACDMLSSGKKRVCCFDQSGFYSKSLSAPQAAD